MRRETATLRSRLMRSVAQAIAGLTPETRKQRHALLNQHYAGLGCSLVPLGLAAGARSKMGVARGTELWRLAPFD